jgi:hypothetical protein
MARLALYFCDDDMRAMRKENMWRQTPHSLPGNLLSLFAKRAQLFYFRAFGISARMTGYTQRSGRPPRNRPFLRALMATCAWNVLRDMSLVRKLDGLLDP